MGLKKSYDDLTGGSNVELSKSIIRTNKEFQTFERKSLLEGVGILGSALNVANTIIGGAIILLPMIMSDFGIVVTLTILFFMFLLVNINMTLLLKSSNLSGEKNYFALARTAFQSTGDRLLNLIIFLNNYGICIVYLIIF